MQVQQLSIPEACRRLAVGRTTLFKLVKMRKLRPTRTRGVRRTTFSERELERFVSLNTREGG